jgi:CheY-like chemotaxis protein
LLSRQLLQEQLLGRRYASYGDLVGKRAFRRRRISFPSRVPASGGEPFFTTKGERGTGLGLAMVYGVVQRHGADLEIDSALGSGTAARLIFPVAGGSLDGVASSDTPQLVPRRMRILVVDDDLLIIRTLCEVLERDGHEVITASGGQAGIDAFSAAQVQQKPFTVVITDLGMPRIASYVKSVSESTPVILLTGWGQRLLAEEGLPPDVDQVLSKPPKLRELREALSLCTPASEPVSAPSAPPCGM